MNKNPSLRRTLGGGLALVALTWFGRQVMPIADAQSAGDIPTFEVDAAWPKPLPNSWAVGPVSGIATDARDHIWIIHRGETVKQAGGVPAPPVIEFDADGSVVQTWGGPGEGYEWPQQVHGITVDAKDRIWVSGNGERDTHILAFSRAGKFLSQIGRPGQSGGSHITAHVSQATQMRVDLRSNELYVSDGETNRNHRVIVFDSETGAYKRHWGAYGGKPDDAAAARNPIPPLPLQSSLGMLCTACESIETASSMCAIGATADSRSFGRTAALRGRSSSRSRRLAERWRTSISRQIRHSSTSPMARIRRYGFFAAINSASSGRSASAAPGPASSPPHCTI